MNLIFEVKFEKIDRPLCHPSNNIMLSQYLYYREVDSYNASLAWNIMTQAAASHHCFQRCFFRLLVSYLRSDLGHKVHKLLDRPYDLLWK